MELVEHSPLAHPRMGEDGADHFRTAEIRPDKHVPDLATVTDWIRPRVDWLPP